MFPLAVEALIEHFSAGLGTCASTICDRCELLLETNEVRQFVVDSSHTHEQVWTLLIAMTDDSCWMNARCARGKKEISKPIRLKIQRIMSSLYRLIPFCPRCIQSLQMFAMK